MDYTSCNPDGIRSLATDSPWSPLQSKINYAGANNRDTKLQLFRNVTTILRNNVTRELIPIQ